MHSHKLLGLLYYMQKRTKMKHLSDSDIKLGRLFQCFKRGNKSMKSTFQDMLCIEVIICRTFKENQ